ncbi:enoyl-CoA hydratase/carnithine racemase [Chromobacterium alkanivorans]|uniref:enoyl-CoA hydratase-related protein n=1 Tax=Chromobacterium alkanivorans TaxID=1071719 RepID=UPI002168ABA6|nr:enoyl-CoA hydratase-related protein [Chromobacterium alkanivorans]MCS3802918.1 enoyl-CoA hydratase/carnithine racemase [Chromobacterium alkanivorans]MCS3817244.1 enoyl-CoA hydratase/carnithine racemase [Chromobacterium alkanivorans]MCS3872284.1 enoyl-CoA hydratase/carnithine racemase [Chromobacterium alkanivorans]
MDELVLLDYPSAGVARLRLNRPQARNALNMALRRELARRFQALSAEAEVRAVLLCGDSRAFAAGADLAELADCGSIELMQRQVHKLWQAIADCPKPVIAAVAGYALGGGCELAMHADIIVAAESAQFGQPEVKVGVMPGAGGTQRLLRAVGKFRAMKLLLSGEPVGAAEALAMGLVSEVVADEALEARALELAAWIAALPPLAVAQIKEVVLAGADAPLATALMLERKAYQLLFASRDQKEGMRAFLDKRAAVFRGE